MVNSEEENFSEERLRKIDVHELLPQQEPFVMIGSLVHFDKLLIITEMEVRESNIFVDDGYFSPSGLMENIAQTCAARIGFVNKYILKKGVQLGFIGAVRNFEVIERPRVGDMITTRVEIREEVFGMTLVDAVVTCGEKVLVKSEMKISVREQNA